MRFTVGCAFIFVAAALAAPPDSSPDDLYQRVRQRVVADIDRLPNYTCVQTITRRVMDTAAKVKRPPSCDEIIREHNAGKHSQPLLFWDRLRIDVAIADQHEIYSWVGADRFEKDDLHELVGEGQTSMGDFGSLLLSILSDHASMRFQGERKDGARRLFEYTYETPEALSDYKIKVRSVLFTTAYDGSIFMDPEMNDVVRVTARSAQLPEQTGYCQTVRELDFGREHIGADEALIPKEARALGLSRDAAEMVNVSSYASCHEYVGESVLRFGDPDSLPPATATATAPQNSAVKPGQLVAIPPGLPFDCRIVTPIDSDTAAMGDPVEAVLRSPIMEKNGTVLAPVGTHIRGRLMRFEVWSEGPRQRHEIGVRFRWIDLAGSKLPFAASLA